MSKKEIYRLQNGSDIRGTACLDGSGQEIDLTKEIVYKLGFAFANWLSIKTKKEPKNLKIGIGRDSRITGQELLSACVSGLVAGGAKVSNCSLSTTPAMFMSCIFEQTDFDGSVMITASHLPFNKNGLKFFDKNGGLDHEDITIILEMADSLEITYKDETPQFYSFNLIDLYSAHLRSVICRELKASEDKKPLTGLKIVVDSGNGSSGFFVEKILNVLGADTNGSQFLEPDGMFPNHIPNPENKQAMKSIQSAVIKNKADLGLIFDTDVDRMGAVFDDGTEISRNSMIALICAIIAPQYPKSTIVTDSVTSDTLTYFLEKELGLYHLRYMRGYKNVINKQIELNEKGVLCPLAMETSGHGALKENYYLDDGAYLAVKIIIALAKLKKEGKKLSSLIEKLPPICEQTDYRLKILEEDFEEYGKTVLEDFEQFAFEGNIEVQKSYEGVRLRFDSENCKGWILLRLSLHENVMPLNMEGERPGDLEKLKKAAKRLLGGFDGLDLSSLENS